jgi:hypothetical protein
MKASFAARLGEGSTGKGERAGRLWNSMSEIHVCLRRERKTRRRIDDGIEQTEDVVRRKETEKSQSYPGDNVRSWSREAKENIQAIHRVSHPELIHPYDPC